MSSESIRPRSSLIDAYWRRRPDLYRLFVARSGAPGDADDLLQDLYLKIETLDPAGIANPDAYLFRLAMNLMLDHQRQRIRRARREAKWGADTALLTPDGRDGDDAPDAGLRRGETLARLGAAIDQLPPRTRQAFRLHKLDELPHSEVARRMGISRSAVEKHIMRALRRLLPLAEEER